MGRGVSVEFAGSPGAGKSTLYRELLKDKAIARKFSTVDEARRKIISSHLWLTKPRRWARKLVATYNPMGLSSLRVLAAKATAENEIGEQEEVWRDFVASAFQAIALSTAPASRKILRAEWFCQSVRDKSIFLGKDISVLEDEGFVQRGWGFFSDKEFNELAESYFSLMPLPDLVVMVNADPEVVLQRFYRRAGKEMPVGLELEEELDYQNRSSEFRHSVAKTLLRRGAKIIAVDTTQGSHDLLDEVRHAVLEL